MAFDILEPSQSGRGFDVLEPVTKGYDVLEPQVAPQVQLNDLQKAQLQTGMVNPSSDRNMGEATSPQEREAMKIGLEAPMKPVMAPLNALGQVGNAALQDAMTTVTGHPEYGGNLLALWNQKDEEPLPYQKTLASIAPSNPGVATAGKLAATAVESAPIAAAVPAGAVGRLASIGFTADMVKAGGEAALVLDDELSKPPAERNADRLTTALSTLATSAVFAPLAAKHGMMSEIAAGKVAPEQAAQSLLNIQPRDRTPTVNPPQAPPGVDLQRYQTDPEYRAKVSGVEIGPDDVLPLAQKLAADAGVMPPEPTLTAPSASSEVPGATASQTSAPALSPAEQPSSRLLPRAETPVAARPARNGRDTSARDAWDEQHGIMRRGGRTHNDDGTPYQPTVLDEVMADVIPELGKSSDQDQAASDMTGNYGTAMLGNHVRQMLDAGWVWDSKTKTLVHPDHPGLTAKQYVANGRKFPTPVEKTLSAPPSGEQVPRPGDAELDRWSGPAYRALNYNPPKNASIGDIIRYEGGELGNTDIQLQAVSRAAKLGLSLDDVPASKAVWITRTPEEAAQYASAADVQPRQVHGWVKLVDLGSDGYLLVDPDVLKISTAPENPATTGPTSANASREEIGTRTVEKISPAPAGQEAGGAMPPTPGAGVELLKKAARAPKNTRDWPTATKAGYEVVFKPYGEQGAGFYQKPIDAESPAWMRPIRIKLKSAGPQTYTVEERLKATPVEIANGEQPLRVRNERTGEVSVVMEGETVGVKGGTFKKGETVEFSVVDRKGQETWKTGTVAENKGLSVKILESESPTLRNFTTVESKFVRRPQPKTEPTQIPQGPGGMTRPVGGKEAPETYEGTSLKNAVAEMERVGLGLNDAPETVRRDMAADWDKAGETLKADADAGRKVVSALAEDPARGVTPEESALLLRHKTTLLNQLNDAAEATIRKEAGAQDRYQKISDELQGLMDTVKTRGTTWGREGRWRQAMAKEDFSFAAMEQQARAAVEGRPLTEVETAEIKRLHDRIAELEKAAEAARTKDSTAKAEKAAQETIGQIRNKASAGTPDPERISKAKAKLKTAKDEGATGTDIGSLIQQLARGHVEKGVVERNALIDAVHADVKDIGFDLTRRETMDAISGYGDFRQLTKDAVSVKLRDLKGQMQQLGKLEDMQAGRAPSKTGVERRAPSDEERRLIKQVEEAKRRGGFKVTDPATQLKSALESKKTRLKNQISDLDAQIKSKQKIVKQRTPSPEDAETTALRAKRDELQAEYDTVFQEDLTNYRKMLEKRIAEYERKIKENDFAPKVKVDRKLDPETLRVLAKAEQAKMAFWKKKAEWQLAQRDPAKKVLDAALNTAFAARNVMTAFDVSAPGRQGAFISLGNPGRLAQNIKPMLEALVSETRAKMVEQEIRNRPNYVDGTYQRAKLYISPLDAVSLSAMEEAAMGHWTQKIPGIRASNRAYITFLNKLRADSFDAMLAAAESKTGGKVDPATETALANFANVATGRGNMGKAAGAAAPLATLLFSPRLLVSRFQLLGGEPLYHGTALSRQLVAKEYAKTMLGATAVLTLASFAGATVQTDPRSSDFLKIRFGNTRLDVLGGLPQVLQFAARMATGEKITGGDKVEPLRENYRIANVWRDVPMHDKPGFGQEDAFDVMARFGRTKLAPTLGGSVDLLTGKNVVGQPVTIGSTLKAQFAPLAAGDVITAFKTYDVPEATAISILSLFGVGTQTYDTKEKK